MGGMSDVGEDEDSLDTTMRVPVYQTSAYRMSACRWSRVEARGEASVSLAPGATGEWD